MTRAAIRWFFLEDLTEERALPLTTRGNTTGPRGEMSRLMSHPQRAVTAVRAMTNLEVR